MTSTVVTRFAPSPTGFLHIGGARTALFNWLYAKHHGGEFLLRIEDTDQKRSTEAAIKVIIEGMRWLGLSYDREIVWQSKRQARHFEVAQQLIAKGQAYCCYSDSTHQRSNLGFRSKWRDPDYPAPTNIKPVVRLKVPEAGSTIINDQVYGQMEVVNNTLEDLVLLRSDGTPTYMLSVVIDDHDMHISHVIRGSDHITNTAKQILIYQALGWDIPIFAHIPLIHGPDGSKLSKRHGALGVDEYEKMGFLPEAMRNYLLRLGWSHGDEEIISTEQAITWFTLEGVGKSPSNFDLQKLEHINNHYLRHGDNTMEALEGFIGPIDEDKKAMLTTAFPTLTEKAKTLVELSQAAKIFTEDEVLIDAEAQQAINYDLLPALIEKLTEIAEWNKEAINVSINELSMAFPKKSIFQTLRALLTGTMASPAIAMVMLALGQTITLRRLKAISAEKDGHIG